MNRNAIFENVKEIITSNCDYLISNITYESLLYGGDIGLSSVDMLNVIVIVEEQYNIEFPDEMMNRELTVGDIVNWIENIYMSNGNI